jgi:hypothetical protein
MDRRGFSSTSRGAITRRYTDSFSKTYGRDASGEILVIETRSMLRAKEKTHRARAPAETDVVVAIAMGTDMTKGIMKGRSHKKRALVGRPDRR